MNHSRFNNSFVKIPEGPGLGIDINEDFVKKMVETGHTGGTRYGCTGMEV